MAERFGTEHHELIVEPDAMEIIPRIVRHYGEPFADASAIPSFYVAEMARRHVTVALNGDGGDESFAGYPRYVAHSAAGPRRAAARRPLGAAWPRPAARLPAERAHQLLDQPGPPLRPRAARWTSPAATWPT